MSDAEFWGLTLHLYRMREQRYRAAQATYDLRAWETAVTTAKLLSGKSVTAADEFSWLGQDDDSPEMTFEEAAGFFSQLQHVAAVANGERT